MHPIVKKKGTHATLVCDAAAAAAALVSLAAMTDHVPVSTMLLVSVTLTLRQIAVLYWIALSRSVPEHSASMHAVVVETKTVEWHMHTLSCGEQPS